MRNLQETFTYDLQNRLTEVRLGTVQTGTSAYDGYGRMTAKTADGQAVFSNAVYSTTAKPHAMDAAETLSGVFPSQPQSISYTCFDKVSQIVQGNKSLNYTYGYDHQRIFMEEHVGNSVRTKRYVGNCEYVTETSGNTTTQKWLTYLTGPTGVYAVVVTENNANTIHYILKDNLGSWTTIASGTGTVEQRLSYDAWGNLRNPNTWTGDFIGTPMFDRGYTGHEHLYSFGLINMNGRMYDPVMSCFLSVDQYVQSPENAQGFNRYAYCMNNPLRYVDPSGWTKVNQAVGYTPNSFSNANDPYAYCRRPLEPRDIGLRELSTSDPIITWMEGNEQRGGGSGAQGGWYITNNEIYWSPDVNSQKDLQKKGIDGSFIGPSFIDELNHMYYSLLGYRIDMNEGNGLAGKIAPLIDEAFINYEVFRNEMKLFDANPIGDEPQQKWTNFINVIAYNDKINGPQQYCFNLGPIECHLIVGNTENSMKARIEHVNLNKTAPDSNNGYGLVKWSSGYDINFISKASYYDTNPKSSKTVVLIIPPSYWNNFKTRYNSVFHINKP